MARKRGERELEELLEEEGIAGRVLRSKRHLIVEVSHPQGTKKVVSSLTPSCPRNRMNLRALLRRASRGQ